MNTIRKILSIPYEYKILAVGILLAILINMTAR
jgi:hypothetical protein